MATLTLTQSVIGLSNSYQDHQLRAHAVNVDATDMNELLAARLGSTSKVAPVEMHTIAARSGGVATQSGGNAYIEDGWATSRGLATLEFEITGASPVQSQTLTVYGYLHGGSVTMAGGQLPPDIKFVPVKMWLMETQASLNGAGFPVETRRLNQAGNFLLNDNSIQGLHTVRPMDVVNSASALAAFDNEDMPGGALDGFGGTTSGLLSNIGMNISKSANNSTVDYAETILTAATTASFEREYTGDRYSAICSATGANNIKEISLEQNPFIKVMRRTLGYVQMTNFDGFTLGEIATVFENFGQVTNVTLTDTDSFNVIDHRYSTNQMNGSTYETLICSELNNLSNAMMNDFRLSYFHIRASNNVNDGMGQINVNGLPVIYQLGESAPIASKDPDWQYNVVAGVEAFLSNFYIKYNSALIHERTIVDLEINASLFGETEVKVFLSGNENSIHTEVFGTMAGNRFDPTLVTTQGLGQSVSGFYSNLVDYMNF
ncbi:phage protein [Vibrio phage pTD1]|uniref:Phage protein n=1 Tax=Vibrio phage pTD1 TaxID=1938577 RepID=A0A1Q2U301_9CAUD|nr:phage protein [Vibrio phage pTD1]BAW98328.1 phage protein [Vibrio phage pTD1]